MRICSFNHPEIVYHETTCPACVAVDAQGYAEDKVAMLEYEVAQLEEKVCLLEAAQ